MNIPEKPIVPPSVDLTEYIENCVFRILTAKCSPSKEGDRAKDIATMILTAASAQGSLEDTHKFLVGLCKSAEEGRYVEKTGRKKKIRAITISSKAMEESPQ